MRRVVTILILLSSAVALRAQDQNRTVTPREPVNERERIAEACKAEKEAILACPQEILTDHPIHLAFGSIAPQNSSGLGPALVIQRNPSERLRLNFNADAVASTNGSWRAGVYLKGILTPTTPVGIGPAPPKGAKKRKSNEPSPVPEFNLYVQSISLQQIFYYGLGPTSSKADGAVFGMSETIAGGNFIYPLGNSGFALFAELNGRFVNLRGRYHESSPSIEKLYTEATAPGLAQQPAFVQPGAGLRFDRKFGTNLAYLDYRGTYQQYSAVGSPQYSFRRYTIDLQHTFPLYHKVGVRSVTRPDVGPDESPEALVKPHRYTVNREGSIGLRALLVESAVPSGHVVPFYLDPTLGGSDVNGNPMLASYPDYRYRAPNLLLFRASIEHSLWGPLGATAMVDSGRVAVTRSDLTFNHFRHSYAAGLTIRAGGFPQIYLLFAWGGNEGTHTTAYISPGLLGSTARPSLY